MLKSQVHNLSCIFIKITETLFICNLLAISKIFTENYSDNYRIVSKKIKPKGSFTKR